jgi:hypothetical protein
MASSWFLIIMTFKFLHHVAWYVNSFTLLASFIYKGFVLVVVVDPFHFNDANQHYPYFISFYFVGLSLLWCILCKFLIFWFLVCWKSCYLFLLLYDFLFLWLWFLDRCASVQAIETDSYEETKHLISYWILLSLIYLFEYAFMSLLPW